MTVVDSIRALKSAVMLVHSSDLNPDEQDVPLAATFIASINRFLMASLHDSGAALSLPSFVSFFALVSIVVDYYMLVELSDDWLEFSKVSKTAEKPISDR